MRKLLLLVIVLLVIITGCARQTTPPPQLDNKTAAIVNGEKISTVDFERRVEKKKFVLTAQGTDFNGPSREHALTMLREEVIADLVRETLLMQEATRLKLIATDAEVEAVIKEIRANFPDEATFQATIQARGLTVEAMHKYNRLQLTRQKLVQYWGGEDKLQERLAEVEKKAKIRINDQVVERILQEI
ncbi:SurA N-terminal domain-containing protein [Carboxydocella sporoproducens DSM 16521]|uniref:SurA N-terminal domain-containing protein n=2 Tax=Carboxydocella TaxID=178898 RepID=A0A1T4PKQ5_9FIRM|nr:MULTISPECIES: SurA N-terminal domain-containing protein [Carboxydocella]AVX19495.1 SurA N-terminal domain-containing protein [Carboxydocella thermautotrophica]SJZ92130.1 SurA N-terminal domain-containing protein [Carboxydocella sporoproducens DSM 16521]